MIDSVTISCIYNASHVAFFLRLHKKFIHQFCHSWLTTLCPRLPYYRFHSSVTKYFLWQYNSPSTHTQIICCGYSFYINNATAICSVWVLCCMLLCCNLFCVLIWQQEDFEGSAGLLGGTMKRVNYMMSNGKNNRKLMCYIILGLVVIFIICYYFILHFRSG